MLQYQPESKARLQQMNVSDRKTQLILQTLAQDARISNSALAERVGLSPSACLRRVQELERAGVIRGYRTRVDRAQLSRGFLAYLTVGLNDHTRTAQRAFEEAVSSSKEVIECHNITGAVEYLLRVEVADIAAYKRFHTDVLGTLPQVHSISTFVVLDSPKDDRD